MTMAEILVVDDERMMRTTCRDMLVREGHAVREAKDGPEAIAEYLKSRPDLVLLDLMMPGMDGVTACRRLRQLDPSAVIIILTARDGDLDEIDCLESGAEDFVSKSASDELLLVRVRKALRRLARESQVEVPAGLTKIESDIYRLLKSKPGHLFSYREIEAAIGGRGYTVSESTIRSHLTKLRGKLGGREGIQAVRGIGFALQKT